MYGHAHGANLLHLARMVIHTKILNYVLCVVCVCACVCVRVCVVESQFFESSATVTSIVFNIIVDLLHTRKFLSFDPHLYIVLLYLHT